MKKVNNMCKKSFSNNNEKRNVMVKREICSYAEKSLNMEKSRQEIIFSKSEANITSISILLVALFTIIFELLDRLKNIETLLIVFSIILTFVLLLSLFFAIKSQWMKKNQYTRSALEFFHHINNHINEYSNEEAFLDQRISDLESLHKTLESNNNKRVIDLMVSSIFLYIFFFLILVFGITLLIVAI